jgi:hypothetical protein
MVTRAATFTRSYSVIGYTPTDQSTFRRKGKSLTDKLYDEFTSIDTSTAGSNTSASSEFAHVASAFSTSMQISACTLFGGGNYATIFYWTNPIAPTPVIVDHLIITIKTAGGAASTGIIGRCTQTGLGQNNCTIANRALATNSYIGASRNNISVGLVLSTASFYDSRKGDSFQRSGTILEGAMQYLSGRALTARPATLAGTVYVFWHKVVTAT